MKTSSPSKYFNLAKQLLEQEGDMNLKYAALELRFCIEAITYKKLNFYKDLLPLSIWKEWRPHPFFRALIRLEPNAGKDYSISMGRDKTPSVAVIPTFHVGDHKTFDMKWLQKHYQKLSKVLHVGGLPGDYDVKGYLEEVVGVLSPIVNSSLESSMAQRISIPCGKCGEKIPINVEAIKPDVEYECLSTNCGCTNILLPHKETGVLNLKPNRFEFPCMCERKIYLKSGELKIGSSFCCGHCHQNHRITHFKASANPIHCDARFNAEKTHRYLLERSWGHDSSNFVNFILLNPSIADEEKDDPTVSKCMFYARKWGFDGLYITNLFALRSTNPKLLRGHDDPIGENNDECIKSVAKRSAKIVCAWGNEGELMNRSQEVINLVKDDHKLFCLKLTKSGQPHHPLYFSRKATPILLFQNPPTEEKQ